MVNTLKLLFDEVRERSDHFKKAQEHLIELAKELDPSKDDTDFGCMMDDLNDVLGDVFPNARLHAAANLSEPDKSIVPSFDIEMSSNVRTPVNLQGTGLIRSAVFAVLRFVKKFHEDRISSGRSLLIAFEEPEIYLHPNAVNNLRDVIYDLSIGSSQIVCSTHSPYMIDLSRKPRQILNNISIVNDDVVVTPLSVTDEFKKLQQDDQVLVKMLMRMDDYSARAFFAKKVIIVEGDTEDIVMRETIKHLPDEIREVVQAEVQVVKARGKWTIPGLVKYYSAMGINLFVIHDRDQGTEQAERANPVILEALGGDETKRCMMEECVEDMLGYAAPSKDKPAKAFREIQSWDSGWDGVPLRWKQTMEHALDDYFSL